MHKPIIVLAWLGLLSMCFLGCRQAEPVILLQTRVATSTASPKNAATQTPWVITATPQPTPIPTVGSAVQKATPRAAVALGYVSRASDSDSADGIHELVAEYLSDLTTLDLVVVPSHSHRELGDMLCAGDVDVAWLSTPGYLLAHDQCGAEAVFRGIRHGTSWHRGAILVQTNSLRAAAEKRPIRSLEDLEGLSIAYTTKESTSGYLLPWMLIQDAAVQPGDTVFYGGDRQAVLAVYRGEVDAAACYWLPLTSSGVPGDARALLSASLPDVYGRLEILALTQPIPNDPLVVQADLDPTVRVALLAGLAEMAGAVDGRDLLLALYGLEGLEPTADEDYDSVREMGRELGLNWRSLAE